MWSCRKTAKLKTLSVVNKYFFSIKLLHAHLQYVCNISAKHWKDPMKALRGVDFTKYVPWVIIQTYYCKNNKNIFSASNFFMHIFNMFVTYLPSVEKIHWKLQEELISQSMHYQPLFSRCSHRKRAKLKALSVCQKVFFQHHTSSCKFSVCL